MYWNVFKDICRTQQSRWVFNVAKQNAFCFLNFSLWRQRIHFDSMCQRLMTSWQGSKHFTCRVNFIHRGHHLTLHSCATLLQCFQWNASVSSPLLSHCSLLWELSTQLPSDMELKTFPEKPIRWRLVILRPPAASAVSQVSICSMQTTQCPPHFTAFLWLTSPTGRNLIKISHYMVL